MKKRLSVSVCALICLFAAGRICIAQANQWNGSWKLDQSSLHFEGATFSVVADADGFTMTRGGQAQPKLVCDGAAQKDPSGAMITCTKSSDGYALSVTKDGKTVQKVTISISSDGNMRTSKTETFPSNGAPFTRTMIAERVSGGPGPGGEWKEVKFSSSEDSGILSIAIHGDSVDFKETDSPKPITCKLDGTETAFGNMGTMSVRIADAHTLKVTYKSDGKIRRENTFALSEDGKKITETDVTPDPSPSTMSVVLDKM